MKKKILLIQPENVEINNFRKKQFNNFVQITMPYLAGFIDEKLYEITIVDEYNEKIPFKKYFDLVAITVNTPNANHCYEIAKKFRKSGSKIVMGGPHVTLLTGEVMEYADHILVGECEDTWPLFLQDFYLDKALKLYIPTKPPQLINLPKPRWDLLKNRFSIMKGAVFATRGCKFNCKYCNLKQIYFDVYRTRPIDEVIEEIKLIRSKFFVFWDDNFFTNIEYAKNLLKKLKPLKKHFAVQVTLASCDDDELLKLSKEAGCLYFFVGIESFQFETLKYAGKQINNINNYKKIINKIHKYKIMVQAGIVFGFDYDTLKVFENTLIQCEKLGIDGATVSILTPLPKTPIYNQMKLENRLLSNNWNVFDGKTNVAFVPKNMTPKQLFDGYMYFRKNFYSLKSILKRIKVSKTHPVYNFIINLGYKICIKPNHKNYN